MSSFLIQQSIGLCEEHDWPGPEWQEVNVLYCNIAQVHIHTQRERESLSVLHVDSEQIAHCLAREGATGVCNGWWRWLWLGHDTDTVTDTEPERHTGLQHNEGHNSEVLCGDMQASGCPEHSRKALAQDLYYIEPSVSQGPKWLCQTNTSWFAWKPWLSGQNKHRHFSYDVNMIVSSHSVDVSRSRLKRYHSICQPHSPVAQGHWELSPGKRTIKIKNWYNINQISVSCWFKSGLCFTNIPNFFPYQQHSVCLKVALNV